MGRIRKKIRLVKRGRGKAYPLSFYDNRGGNRVEEKGVFLLGG